MDIKEIETIAREVAGFHDIPKDCSKGGCKYKEDGYCCQVGAYYTIQKKIKEGIENGIRKGAALIPETKDERAKYNIQLQHDGHNELDRLREMLYRLDKEKVNKEGINSTVVYVAAEYLRSGIEKMRFILNEYYLNNKNCGVKN